jgi:hypothetical protein
VEDRLFLFNKPVPPIGTRIDRFGPVLKKAFMVGCVLFENCNDNITIFQLPPTVRFLADRPFSKRLGSGEDSFQKAVWQTPRFDGGKAVRCITAVIAEITIGYCQRFVLMSFPALWEI